MSHPIVRNNSVPVAKPPATAMRLWVVDDDEFFRSAYASLLGDYGMLCEHQFGSAEEMIAMLGQASAPDLLLMDNGLPGMHGAAAVKVVKSLSPSTCVFVISALKSFRDTAEALEGGASGCFEKTDPLEALVISMRVALSRRG